MLPLLMLVAPALRVHPATDTLLRYIAPEIEWSLIGIDESWREGVRVIFRKRRTAAAAMEAGASAGKDPSSASGVPRNY